MTELNGTKDLNSKELYLAACAYVCIKRDYVAAKAQLDELTDELKETERDLIKALQLARQTKYALPTGDIFTLEAEPTLTHEHPRQ